MELRNLRHFIALAEERSFTKAAARELIVQSGLSSSIRALERDLGVLLFVRGTRPVRLTAEGAALVPSARRTLDAAASAAQAVREVHGLLSGQFRIGALATIGHTLPFARWLAEFALAHPGLDISAQVHGARLTPAMVANGELDCALWVNGPKLPPGLTVVELVSEPIGLACAPSHPLAAMNAVRFEQLDGERFVEPPASWAIRSQVEAVFRERGLTRRIACEVNEWTMVLDLVAAGVGISFVPLGLDFSLHPRPDEALRLIPLADVRLDRRIDFIYPSGHAASPAARRFAELLEHHRAVAVEQNPPFDVPLDGP